MTAYRISFGLTIFFVVQSIMMIGVRNKVNENNKSISILNFSFNIYCIFLSFFYFMQNDIRAKIQNGFWFFKVLALVGLIAAAFYIPVPFYIYYAYENILNVFICFVFNFTFFLYFFIIKSWFALVASIVFLFFQLILLVDFAHRFVLFLLLFIFKRTCFKYCFSFLQKVGLKIG